MKVSDYIAEFIAGITPRVYGVCGAGAMHLNDSIANHPALEVIPMHHEQAAMFAAEADQRVNGGVGVVMVTAGPGGTNALTGLGCAFVDSIPMIAIAGQVTSTTMAGGSRRQGGMNELPLPAMARPVTKMALTIERVDEVQRIMNQAYRIATSGRSGPVFVEVPLDIQAANVNPVWLPITQKEATRKSEAAVTNKISKAFRRAKRPVILFGHGIRLAGACEQLKEIASINAAPMVASWGGADILPSNHPALVGRCGIFGDRKANHAIYHSDFILVLGSRLSPAQTGHSEAQFAPFATIAMVDIDVAEVMRPFVDLAHVGDVKEFLETFNSELRFVDTDILEWRLELNRIEPFSKEDDNVSLGEAGQWINSYELAEALPNHLEDDAVIVTDVGFSYIPFFQSLPLNGKQRLIHSHGVSPMGWAIPAAVGAAMANSERQVVCLTGDGGAMMNVQELATIAHHNLPVTILLFENGGYATMRIAQQNHFKREVMAGDESGLKLPNLHDVASAFGIKSHQVSSLENAERILLDRKKRRDPCLIVLHMNEDQLIAPRLQAKLVNGKFVTPNFCDLWPGKESHDVPNKSGSQILGATAASDRLVGQSDQAFREGA